MGKAICLDAGHGGSDPGATWFNVNEKTLNLEYTLALRDVMKQRGWTVLLTRDSDINVPPLKTRCRLINRHHQAGQPPFDAVVSLHCNVAAFTDPATGEVRANPATKGLYAIYGAESTSGTSLARSIAKKCEEHGVALRHGGMLTTVDLGRSLAWIHQTVPPATLVELGFLTNPGELNLLQTADHRRTLVSAIAEGIDLYANSAPGHTS